MEQIYLPIEHRYVVELAVMDERPGWTIDDVDNAPADLIDLILYRRSRRAYWEEEAEKWRAGG